jgi:hypothetical protein
MGILLETYPSFQSLSIYYLPSQLVEAIISVAESNAFE